MITWTFSMVILTAVYMLGLCTGMLVLRWRLAKIEAENLRLSQDRIEKVKLLLNRKSPAGVYKRNRRRKKFVPAPLYDERKLKSEIEEILKNIHCK